MTRAEQKVNSINKEIEKLTKSLERYNNLLTKKVAKCKELECNWTREEMFVKRENNEMSDKQWSAYFDKSIAEGNVEDTQERLQNAFRRLERANTELEKVAEQIEVDEAIDAKELAWLEAAQKSEEEYYQWLKQFRIECLKDGIIIDEASGNYIYGSTRGGKRFSMYINGGWTKRSFHSYTLRIDDCVFFTSGLFSTGYKYLMSH